MRRAAALRLRGSESESPPPSPASRARPGQMMGTPNQAATGHSGSGRPEPLLLSALRQARVGLNVQARAVGAPGPPASPTVVIVRPRLQFLRLRRAKSFWDGVPRIF